MNVKRKYTAIKIGTKTVDDTIKVTLEYGEITGPYYSQEYPEEVFDTEEEAIAYAYEFCSYSRWMIVPIVTFEE
tara:strand:+ start:3139 stop:3360 length:222 start_codon:yes stop_codon:yes gene_type:complete